jgi:hypothetical protein
VSESDLLDRLASLEEIEMLERLLKLSECGPHRRRRRCGRVQGRCWHCRSCRRFNGSPRSRMPQGREIDA